MAALKQSLESKAREFLATRDDLTRLEKESSTTISRNADRIQQLEEELKTFDRAQLRNVKDIMAENVTLKSSVAELKKLNDINSEKVHR